MIIGITATIIVACFFIVTAFLNQASFGKLPRGECLERIKQSTNYKNGKFENLHETVLMTSNKGRISGIWNFLFRKNKGLRPIDPIPAIKTNLHNINRNENVLVWFGHSSYLIQLGSKRILVDPVCCMASPVSFVNKSFKGTDKYSPEDMPAIDYLIITHDHKILTVHHSKYALAKHP